MRRLCEVSQPFSRTQLLGALRSLLQTAQREGWGGAIPPHCLPRPSLAPHYHICLVEKWVGPKEQIYCGSRALGSIPAARNWSGDKEKCVWLQAQSLRIHPAPAVGKANAAVGKAPHGQPGRCEGGAAAGARACSLAACNLIMEQKWFPEKEQGGATLR